MNYLGVKKILTEIFFIMKLCDATQTVKDYKKHFDHFKWTKVCKKDDLRQTLVSVWKKIN